MRTLYILKNALDAKSSRFALASFENIRRENILKLFQKYDTNGLDPKEFMDEIKLNMI